MQLAPLRQGGAAGADGRRDVGAGAVPSRRRVRRRRRGGGGPGEDQESAGSAGTPLKTGDSPEERRHDRACR
jgi:hypothetical protein